MLALLHGALGFDWLVASKTSSMEAMDWLCKYFHQSDFWLSKAMSCVTGITGILGQNQTHILRKYEKSCPKQVSKPLFYFVQAKWAGHMESNVRRNTCKISMPRLVIIKYVRLAATSVSARKSGTQCAEWDNWKLTTTRYLLPWKIDSLFVVWANVHISKWRL